MEAGRRARDPESHGFAERSRLRRHRRPLLVLAGLVVILAVEAIPGVPGHNQVSLAGELLTSDGSALASKIPLFHSASSNPCEMIESEFEAGNHLLKNSQFGWYASIWPTYQALTSFEVRSLTDHHLGCGEDFETTLRAVDANYWDRAYPVPAFDQGPNPFHVRSDLPRVDDSLWMGLALMSGYATTRNRSLLRRAESVFRLAVGNWDPLHGGIYWEDHLRGATIYDKAVVSNAPAAILGVELFVQTGAREYLDWSERIVRWLHANLLDARTGLYHDGIDDHGRRPKLHPIELTYDEGAVLGAMAALSIVDPGAYPLSRALRFAARCESFFARHHSYGHPAFDAIWAFNLLWVAGLAHERAFTEAALVSLRRAIAAEPRRSGDLLDRGSDLTLAALAALPASDYLDLYPAMTRLSGTTAVSS
ncbi:MAG TPA: glycoside hydrolase family 76 protein [Acidimicrobiales bacterium]|nr:glycoside hydrolase family 76 protein [Acidimicrobiales bacterium]